MYLHLNYKYLDLFKVPLFQTFHKPKTKFETKIYIIIINNIENLILGFVLSKYRNYKN